MMTEVTYQNLIPHILEQVPEIRKEYEIALQFSHDVEATPNSDPLLDSESLHQLAASIWIGKVQDQR